MNCLTLDLTQHGTEKLVFCWILESTRVQNFLFENLIFTVTKKKGITETKIV